MRNRKNGFWSLYRLLVGLNQSDRAQEILQSAYQELQRQAKNISEPNQRRGFFEQVPDNSAIVNAYDLLVGGLRVVSVLLGKDVPLGRTLRKEEFVTVDWTLNAVEDDLISDKADRRLYRLKRLIDEAGKARCSRLRMMIWHRRWELVAVLSCEICSLW